ncbi:MAG TPA: hypothetical protein VK034_19335, partial [Enhygromyxa sp.]|nr:hypothetical protein [Enhygromyxa sp.]
ASVMLDKFHDPPASGALDLGDSLVGEVQAIEVVWEPPTALLRATHANEHQATEDGAYAVAFAVANDCGYRVRRRAHHGSGADYLLTRAGEPTGGFVKLEVSGVARPRKLARLRARMKQKLRQLERGDLQGPGLAVVVGFESVEVLMRTMGGRP